MDKQDIAHNYSDILDKMEVTELINHAKLCYAYNDSLHGQLEVELLKRLEIAMDIIAHDSQQQSNH